MAKSDRKAAAQDVPDLPDLPDLPTLFVRRLNARTLAWKLGGVILVLVLAHIVAINVYYGASRPAGLHHYMISMFDLDNEESFGTYFSALMLLGIGQILWHYGRHLQRQGDRSCWWWMVLGVGFHWLSIDEVVALHEVLNVYYKDQAPLETASRWTDVAKPVALVVGLAYLPFLWKLRWRTAIWFLVGGAIYVLGAVGVEEWTDWYEIQGMLDTVDYNMWTAVEEALEMIGPVVFLHALLAHISGSSRGTVTRATEVRA